MSAQGPSCAGGTGAAAWSDRYAAEDPVLAAARARAAALGGPPPPGPAAGATLAVLAAGAGARAVVSIGSGGGVVGLWLLRGMRPDGVLTALDADPEQLREARRAFAEARIPQSRTRLIFGTPGEVLPRLSPGAYDLVVCAGRPTEYAPHLAALLALVRTGGTLACHGLLEGDRVGDRAARDPDTVAWRDLAHNVREDEGLTSAVLPIGAGLLVATRRG
ncbi:O-methyltransferase [Geodermatophilus sp. SYSU D01180]